MPGGRGGIGGGAVGGGGGGGGFGGGMHGHYGAAAGDVNFRALFQDFNASKFVVFSSLLVFSILYALKLDGILESWSWWSVFAPLWAWKCIVVLGAIVGSYVWWRRPQSRLNPEEYIQYKAMLISLATHLLLLMFELLAADNLESRRHYWILVFVPLVFVGVVSVAVCIWSVRHDRPFELELFCAVNILQFVFLALKLDRLITWPWEICFVPLWIVLCISLVGVLYTIIFAGILLRMPEVNAEQRRTSTNSALGYSFLVIPLLVFLVLLTNKLDGSIRISFFSAFAPLFLTFFTLVITSFGSRGGNQYWFGLRKPPCQFLFGVCPCLQLFGNISYSLYSASDANSGNQPPSTSSSSGAVSSESEMSVAETMANTGSGIPISVSVMTTLGGGGKKSSSKKDSACIVVPANLLDVPD